MNEQARILARLETIEKRFNEVNEQLSDPNNFADPTRMAKLAKELKDLTKIMDAARSYRIVVSNIENARELLTLESDPEMREMAKEEITSLLPKTEEWEAVLKQLLVPKDPYDGKNCIMEIRAGTGGDEASLFAGDLLRMYQKYAELSGFRFEVTDFHEGTVGGFKEVVVNISGPDAYGTFKYESGVHRVQRVPTTETQGRVHTSAATVAVMPEPEEFDIVLNDNDIRKETFCSQGAGGQSVNTTYSAVRLTHIPTGIVVSMQNERSQIKNYDLALKILKTRIYDLEMQKRMEEAAAIRKTLVSTGDRSAKIRTYNFPQSRVTDHRIGLSSYNLSTVLDGELHEFIDALKIAENADRMENEMENALA